MVLQAMKDRSGARHSRNNLPSSKCGSLVPFFGTYWRRDKPKTATYGGDLTGALDLTDALEVKVDCYSAF